MWEPSMISYCVSICLDVTCKSPYVIFKSKRIDLYWLVQYKSSLVIRLSNWRSWTSESFPDLSCYKNSLASEKTFFLSFFLLIENYYSFASAEAILATFSFLNNWCFWLLLEVKRLAMTSVLGHDFWFMFTKVKQPR